MNGWEKKEACKERGDERRLTFKKRKDLDKGSLRKGRGRKNSKSDKENRQILFRRVSSLPPRKTPAQKKFMEKTAMRTGMTQTESTRKKDLGQREKVP